MKLCNIIKNDVDAIFFWGGYKSLYTPLVYAPGQRVCVLVEQCATEFRRRLPNRILPRLLSIDTSLAETSDLAIFRNIVIAIRYQYVLRYCCLW